MVKREWTVGPKDAELTGTTNEIIQAAIDQAAAVGGGIINILPGRYILKDSLHLSSNVTLRGHGSETVLWKPPSISSSVIHNNGYGLFAVAVTEPEKYAIGDGVHITDDRAGGFTDAVATVCWIRGNEIGLTRSLNHDIAGAANGRVTTVYPMISGYDLENAVVENLVIDGNAEQNAYLNGCRGGGIFLLRTDNVQLRNVTVKNYNGDGISFQQCTNTLVESCSCINNTGCGLHPGSGSVGFVFRDSKSIGNGKDGIYYCLRVSYSLCEDCLIEGNGQDGLSIGHRDTDAIIRKNRIASNGRHGIFVRNDLYNQSGHRTLVENNVFQDNNRAVGDSDIFFTSGVADMHIVHNSFQSAGHILREKTAITVAAPPERIVVCGNETVNCSLLKTAEKSYMEEISFQATEHSLQIGPSNAPSTATGHLQGRIVGLPAK
jgi:hypothetical protein